MGAPGGLGVAGCRGGGRNLRRQGLLDTSLDPFVKTGHYVRDRFPPGLTE